MSYAIIGETIKSATSIKLEQIFPNCKRYKENVVNPEFPNFYIQQVTLNIKQTNPKRNQLDYLMNINYRLASDISSVVNLEQSLDEIGLKLCTELTDLQLEKPIKVKNSYYVKDNGILQFFFNITIFAKPEESQINKFNDYILNMDVIK